MEIKNYKAINKNTLIANFSLLIPKWGNFIIREIAYFKKDNKRWISFPCRIYEKDGEKKYFPYMAFGEDSTFKTFQEKVLALLDEFLAKNPLQENMPNLNEVPF